MAENFKASMKSDANANAKVRVKLETKNQEEMELGSRDDIFSTVSPEHLEKLLQICSEDGIAVLEYQDENRIFIAEKNDDDNYIVWQMRKGMA